MKQITLGREARESLERGVNKLSEAVASTLGAKGNNVIFQHGKNYFVTKDGVTVASQVELEDPVENAAAQIVKDASSRTARDAGDGTTSSTVIAAGIIEAALRYAKDSGSAMEIKRGIDKAVEDAIEFIDQIKTSVKGEEDIFNIARISGNNDDKIGNMIADIYSKVGKEGAIRIEETQMNDTTVDVIEGCQFNSGYISDIFINNKTKGVADYKDAAILITDKIFAESIEEILPALNLIVEKSNESQKPIPLLIICGGMEGETLGSLTINKVRAQMPVVVVKAPEFGVERNEILEDIAILSGGTFMSEDQGRKIADITLEDFGTADRIVVDKYATTIIGRHGEQEAIDERVASVEHQMTEDREKRLTWRLRKRIATLTGGVGVVYVGGNSESEMKDYYYRIEDALAATKAALEDGYVAGGGVSYLRTSDLLAREESTIQSKDQLIGYQSLLFGLKKPLKLICQNAGLNGDSIMEKVLEEKNANIGYDVLKDEYVDMMQAGIIDPAKVVKAAIRNAASVAGMLLTTNCVINDKEKK